MSFRVSVLLAYANSGQIGLPRIWTFKSTKSWWLTKTTNCSEVTTCGLVRKRCESPLRCVCLLLSAVNMCTHCGANGTGPSCVHQMVSQGKSSQSVLPTVRSFRWQCRLASSRVWYFRLTMASNKIWVIQCGGVPKSSLLRILTGTLAPCVLSTPTIPRPCACMASLATVPPD